MKLIPYMIYVEYNHQESLLPGNTLPVKRIVIENRLPYDKMDHFWYTFNHYRMKVVNENGYKEEQFLQIGFKLEGSSAKDVTIQFTTYNGLEPLVLSYNKDFDVWFQKTVFKNKTKKNQIYYPFSTKTEDYLRGLNHSGELEVIVYKKQEFVLKERVLFLPSSISKEHYNIMMTDLYKMRDTLVQNDKVDTTVSIQKRKTIETLEKILSTIEGPIHFINKFPTGHLKIEKNYSKDQSISRFHPEVEIQRQMNPGKSKYKAMIKREDFSIIENKIIMQELKKLMDYSINLAAQKEAVDADTKDVLNEAHSIVRKSSRRIKRKLNQAENLNLDHFMIENLLTEIEEEIKKKHDDILQRKPYLLSLLYKNNSRSRLDIGNYVFVKLELKILANFFEKSMKFSGNTLNVHIGSGKIVPGEKRPSVLLEGYKYYANHKWDGPEKTKSMFCDIYNSSISINEQYLLLKALDDLLGSNDFPERETKLVIVGRIHKNEIKNWNIKDIFGVVKPNSDYRDYEFHFSGIDSIFIGKDQYFIQTPEDNLADELSTLLLPFDQNVQEYTEKMEQLELEKQSVLKLKQLLHKKTDIEMDAARYDSIAKRANNLLTLPMFKGIETTQNEPFLPTQLFLHDPNYKKVWVSLKKMEDLIGAALIPRSHNKRIGIKNVNDIFEIWSLLKMVLILTKEMGWRLSNQKSLIECLDSYLLLNKELKGFYVQLELDDYVLEITYEPSVKFAGDKNAKEPDYRFVFKQRTYMGYMEELGVVYLDAKYRNYKEQDPENGGEQEWKKDIVKVAIEKYGNKSHQHAPYLKTLASFILHPDIVLGADKETKGENYFAYYNRALFPEKLESAVAEDAHKYGSIYMLPTSTHSFGNWFRMIMEYRMNKYEVCWSCGNLKDVKRLTKFTGQGYPKYHYQCQNKECNEYWVKNHCSKKGHKIVKHSNNYHRQPSQDYEWYVVCPTCGDGFEKER